MIYLGLYLVVGILLSEGGMWALRERGEEETVGALVYVFMVVLWPLIIASIVLRPRP